MEDDKSAKQAMEGDRYGWVAITSHSKSVSRGAVSANGPAHTSPTGCLAKPTE